MATPTLAALRKGFPSASLLGVMRPVIRDLLCSNDQSPPWFDKTVVVNKKKSFGRVANNGSYSRLRLIAALRAEQIDVAVLLSNSVWTAAVARLSGAKRVVGYDRDGRSMLLTDRLPVPREGRKRKTISPVDYYLELAAWLGCDTQTRAMQLHVSRDDERLADSLWQELGFSIAQPTLVINNGASSGQTRLWSTEKMIELAKRVSRELGWQVLLHCGPDESAEMNRIAAEIGMERVASMGRVGRLPIGLSTAVLNRAAVVVSSDSGPRHMAVALGRSVITIYGPTDPAWTTTYNTPETEVSVQLACRACYKDVCPLQHHRCMRDITVDRVFNAVAKMAGQQVQSTANVNEPFARIASEPRAAA